MCSKTSIFFSLIQLIQSLIKILKKYFLSGIFSEQMCIHEFRIGYSSIH